MKKILAITLAVLVSSTCMAQRRLKYKTIYDGIGKEPVEFSMGKLKEFQAVMPYFANTYLQIAMMDWAALQKADPFLNYDRVLSLIYETKLYYGIALSKISADDKEVKKNIEYYANVPVSTVEHQAVVDYINQQLEKISDYQKNVVNIVELYRAAVDKYNGCTSLFRQIISYQSNYKNLMLTSDDKLKREMQQLAQGYDSVIASFSEFKSALAKYPIKNYKMELKPQPVRTYRLEGISLCDFLQDEVLIWNYGDWAKKMSKTINGDVTSIKKEAVTNIKGIRERVVTLRQQKASTDTVREILVPSRLVNLIEKYDYESFISNGIKYEAAKANFQIASMRSANNTELLESQREELAMKANYYYDLYLGTQKAREALGELKQRLTDQKVSIHKDFVDDVYGGKSRLLGSFASDESAAIDRLENENLSHFLKFALAQMRPSDLPNPVDDDIMVLNTICDNFGSRYVSGFKSVNETSSSAIVAKLNDDNSVAWKTVVNISTAGFNKAVQVIPTQFAGVVVIVQNEGDDGIKSQAVRLNDAGKLIVKSDLTSAMYPTVSCYDEALDAVSIVMKDSRSADSYDDCLVETVTLGQKETEVSDKFKLVGEVADIIHSRNGKVVVCNYKQIMAGRNSDKKNSGIAAVYLGQGETKASFYGGKTDCQALRAFKVETSTLSILGAEKALGSGPSVSDKPVYIITNEKGEPSAK